MNNTKVLVTGGAGMIGSNLVKRLVKDGNKVIVVDNLWRGKLEYLNDENNNPVVDLSENFLNIDLAKEGIPVKILEDVDYVYHLADIVAGIDYVFKNQSSIFRQNLLINSNVINSVRQVKDNIKGFIYVGTACSFPLTRQNSLDVIPLKEDELYPAMPESSYGWSKLMGQYETELLESEDGIPVSVLMFHNVYGAPCDFDLRSQVIPALIRKAINFPNEDFMVWGSGTQGRAFVHVDDVVDALVLTKEKGLGKGVIQIGPNVCTSIREIAETIVRISEKKITIKYDLTKPEGDKARSADFTKAANVLGWYPKVTLEQGLEKQYRWISKQISNN